MLNILCFRLHCLNLRDSDTGSFKVIMPKNKLVSYIFQGGRGGGGGARAGVHVAEEKRGRVRRREPDRRRPRTCSPVRLKSVVRGGAWCEC